MAFNPFVSFQKYKKFWMATVLLLCMITFVLCTGVGGDLSQRILDAVNSRSGSEVLSLNGRKVYSREFEDLKGQRTVANEFMRHAYEISLRKLDTSIKSAAKEKDGEARRLRLTVLTALKSDLDERLAKKTLFDGGTRLDEIAEFLLWRDEANRLDIRLTEAALRELLDIMVHGPVVGFDAQDSRQAENSTRQGNWLANHQFIVKALTDEFRVQIAKVSLSGCRTDLFKINRQLNAQYRRTANDAMLALYIDKPVQARFPVTPEQINQFYVRNRSDIEVGLVPLTLDVLAKSIAEPTQKELDDFFEKNKSKKFNPYSDQPGFEVPASVLVNGAMADPKMPFYSILAKQAMLLEATPPVLYNPGQSLLATAAAYLVRKPGEEASLQRNYEILRDPRRSEMKYVGTSQSNPAFLLSIYQPKPADVAGLVGFGSLPQTGAAAPLLYSMSVFPANEAKYAPIIAAERKRRLPIGTTLILTAAMQPTVAVEFLSFYATYVMDPFLPFAGYIEQEVRQQAENRIASAWVQTNMQALRKDLEKFQGDEFTFEGPLKKWRKSLRITTADGKDHYGIQWIEMKQPRNRFDIDKDEDLKPFREAFEGFIDQLNIAEGRGGTPRQLRQDDFYKLFFEGEAFGVGSAGKLKPRVWPPRVTIQKKSFELIGQENPIKERDFFTSAEKPIIFWKVADEPSRVPQVLDAERTERLQKLSAALPIRWLSETLNSQREEVMQEVLRTWKTGKARNDLLLPKLGETTKALQAVAKTPEAIRAALKSEAAKNSGDVIFLPKVAPLIEQKPLGPQDNVNLIPYELPRGLIQYPREDAVKQVLAVVQGQEPIKIDWKELDVLNKALFDAKDKGQYVQVLTNKPRTHFYVATVVDNPASSNLKNFAQAFHDALGSRMIEMCQVDGGKTYLRELTQQLWRDARVEVVESARKQYDTDAPESSK